jgi:hypothetical protein
MKPKSPLASGVPGDRIREALLNDMLMIAVMAKRPFADWFCEALLNSLLMIAVMAGRPFAISAVSLVAYAPGLRGGRH